MLSNSFDFPFLTPFAYNPRRGDTDDASVGSRTVCYYLKDNRVVLDRNRQLPMTELIVERMIDYLSEEQLAGFFGSDVVAVPVPGSSRRSKGSLWVPLLLCEQLHAKGLVATVAECVTRASRVNKSSTAGPGGRPDPATHAKSLQTNIDPITATASRVLMVDDVLTRGSTMAGVHSKLKDAGVAGKISGFAMICTKGLGNFTAIRDMTVGTITCTNGSPSRSP